MPDGTSLTTDRGGDWIETTTGPFWPSDPRAGDIDIRAIARGLSHQCRFGGHVKFHYSVAQHSVLCSAMAPPELRLAALLHDASEAYLCDLPTPVKLMLPDYQRLEARVERVICERFGLRWPVPMEVRLIDRRMLVTEARQLSMRQAGEWWNGLRYPEPYDLTIEPLSPRQAEADFLERFEVLAGVTI